VEPPYADVGAHASPFGMPPVESIAPSCGVSNLPAGRKRNRQEVASPDSPTVDPVTFPSGLASWPVLMTFERWLDLFHDYIDGWRSAHTRSKTSASP
jgi:hypothetical protein